MRYLHREQRFETPEDIKIHMDFIFSKGIRSFYSLNKDVLVFKTEKINTYLIKEGDHMVCEVVPNE